MESVVKVRSYGVLLGAFLSISSMEAADAATCDNVCKPSPHAMAHHARARVLHRRDSGTEYAQSFYDYHSASRVTEEFVHRARGRENGFRVAPNDARIRFFRAHAGHGPAMTYRRLYPSTNYAPPAYHPPQAGAELDQQGFNGGVGDMEGSGVGGGYGGQAFLHTGQSRGSDEPANGGGVRPPSGYGPDYHGVWQGPVNPTRGGLSGH
jgi:hypothetical protein